MKKLRVFLGLVAVVMVGLALSGCRKEEAKAPAAPAEVVAPAELKAPAPPAVPGEVEEALETPLEDAPKEHPAEGAEHPVDDHVEDAAETAVPKDHPAH